MADMAIDVLDTARFLLGDPKPVAVYARIGTYYKDFDVDDTGVIMVSGTTARHRTLSWVGGSRTRMVPRLRRNCMEPKGLGNSSQPVSNCQNRKDEKIDIVELGYEFPRKEHCPQSLYDEQMKYFVECIEKKQVPIPRVGRFDKYESCGCGV